MSDEAPKTADSLLSQIQLNPIVKQALTVLLFVVVAWVMGLFGVSKKDLQELQKVFEASQLKAQSQPQPQPPVILVIGGFPPAPAQVSPLVPATATK